MKSSNEKTVSRQRQIAHSDLNLAIQNGRNGSIQCYCYGLPTTPSWIRFENFLRSTLQIQDFKVTYKDEERDEVNLSSDEEFYELLNVYGKINNNLLLIRVTPIKTQEIQSHQYVYQTLRSGNSELTSEEKSEDEENRQQAFQYVYEKLDPEDTELMREKKSEDEENRVSKQSNSFAAPDIDVMPLNIGYEPLDVLMPTTMGCRPKESNPTPPEWFSNYMEKFKGDITIEITKKVMHRMQKLMARNGSLVLKSEENKDPESGDKLTKPVSSVVHKGVRCDNCDQNVIGIRYRCGNCTKYDLCEVCEAVPGIHDPQHVFIKLRYPSKLVALRSRKHGKTGPLLKHLVYDYDDIIFDGNLDKINRSSSSGDAPAPDFTVQWREKKLLKRLEKHAHKLEKYREKHRQRFLDRSFCENVGRRVILTPKEDAVPTSSEDSGIVDKKTTCFNPFWTDLLDAKFINDETIPDGTIMAPGSHFTKRWRLLNSGEMRWPADTVLKLMSANGDKDGLKHSKNQVSVPALLPGDEGIVSVDFVAPFQPGKYESVWRLHVHSNFFGHKIWCSIIVERKSSIPIPMPDVQVDQINCEKMLQEPENGEKEQVPDILKAGLEETTTLKMNKWANFQREDNVTSNGFSSLMVPRCASITATPNNTPLDLTPPKSPEIPEDGNETLFDHSCDTLVTRKRENDADTSFLNSEHGGSVLSLSSTDSDLDYVMVPLPPCFNFSFKELDPSSSNNNNETEASTMPATPTGKEENSSVTAASDTDDENANDIKSNLNFENKNSPPRLLSPPFQLKDYTVLAATLSDHAAVASHIAALAATAAVNNAIPLPPPPPPPPLPLIQERNEEKVEVSQSPPDVCPERIIPILPEPLMSAAATVFNSARGLITSIADKKINTSGQPDVCPSAMAQLVEMGFCDRELNAKLLNKCNNDMTRVIAELLETIDNNWHTNRH
uniref:ZZ-type domain-containing protein n=1 Tax=Strigamia maritima TaxID=126957 RepID=T1JF73_STRMM